MAKPYLPIRLRKFIGMILILLFLFIYTLLIVALATSSHVPESGLIQFLFYLVTGLAWTPPVALIIWWMQRPDE